MTMSKIRWWIVPVGALLASAALALPLSSHAATTAAKAPSVYTGAYAQTGTTSAMLKGGVNPHGVETVYAFQYGTTTGYGAQTAPVAVGSGTTEVKASQTITGLQPGTTYHFRIVAASAAGTTNGLDVAFTTKKIPLTFKIAGTPDPDVFGSPFSVSGVLSGTGAADHEVVLQANPYPYLGEFKNRGNPELTDAGGDFSFPVTNLLESTKFRVVAVGTPSVNSPVVVGRVAVRVSLHLRSTGRNGFVRMYGTVTPTEVGAPVIFQLLRPGLRPRSIRSTSVQGATSGTSRFSRVVRIRRGGLYRALVHVDNGRQVSGHSRAVLIR
jgi:hypothetical protein